MSKLMLSALGPYYDFQEVREEMEAIKERLRWL